MLSQASFNKSQCAFNKEQLPDEYIRNCSFYKQSINYKAVNWYLKISVPGAYWRFFYPGKKKIFRIASTTKIPSQNRKTFMPFDNFGIFILKLLYAFVGQSYL